MSTRVFALSMILIIGVLGAALVLRPQEEQGKGKGQERKLATAAPAVMHYYGPRDRRALDSHQRKASPGHLRAGMLLRQEGKRLAGRHFPSSVQLQSQLEAKSAEVAQMRVRRIASNIAAVCRLTSAQWLCLATISAPKPKAVITHIKGFKQPKDLASKPPGPAAKAKDPYDGLAVGQAVDFQQALDLAHQSARQQLIVNKGPRPGTPTTPPGQQRP